MEHTSHSLQRSAENFFKLRLGSSLVSRHFQGPISPNKLYIRSGNFALQTEIVETLSQVFPGVFSRVVWFRTEMTNMDFSPVFVDDNYGTIFDSLTVVDWVSVLPFVQHDSHQLQMGIFGQVLVDTGAAAGRVGA